MNNHIHRYAQRKKVYQPAVRMYGVGHRIAHNLIHDAPHQAIGYDGNDHVIEFNEIHHVVLESADAGVLYTGCNWTFRGNVVRHNFIHSIPHGPGLGTVGVYLDDCASSTKIFGNVFYDMLKPTFIGGGRDNVIANNIFVECDTPVHLDNRGLRWEHFRPKGPMYKHLERPQDVGHFFCLMDVAAFMDPDQLRQRVDRMIDGVKACRRRPGVDEILIPGELEHRRALDNRRRGIPIGPETIDELKTLCAEYRIVFDLEPANTP